MIFACEIDLHKRASAAIAFGFSQVLATGINTTINNDSVSAGAIK